MRSLSPLRARSAMSIIEVMVVLLIVTVGIVGAYTIVNSGSRLADTTESRIQALAYAQEGLEGIENIRDTNWLRFSSDYRGCFDVLGFDVSCIGSDPALSSTVNRISTGSYLLSHTGGLWQLERTTPLPSSATASTTGSDRVGYVGLYTIKMDSNGLSTQTGSTSVPKCSNTQRVDCASEFTRELKITRPDSTTIAVESIVSWTERSRPEPYVITIPYTLKNWRLAYFTKSN